MPECKVCHIDFPDWGQLTDHILAKKKIHPRYSINFALKFKTRANILNQKKDLHTDRIPLTEEEKQNKEDAHRELSGEVKTVTTLCPNCKRDIKQVLPVEFADNPFAWRSKNGILVVSCNTCRRKN